MQSNDWGQSAVLLYSSCGVVAVSDIMHVHFENSAVFNASKEPGPKWSVHRPALAYTGSKVQCIVDLQYAVFKTRQNSCPPAGRLTFLICMQLYADMMKSYLSYRAPCLPTQFFARCRAGGRALFSTLLSMSTTHCSDCVNLHWLYT